MFLTHREGTIFQYDLLRVQSGVGRVTTCAKTFEYHRCPYYTARLRDFRRTRIPAGLNDAG